MVNNDHSLSKFTGNTCLYLFRARYRQRLFLQRNVDKALHTNELKRLHRQRNSAGQKSPEPAEVAAEAVVEPVGGNAMEAPTRKRRQTINEIANHLSTGPSLDGKPEPVLRFDVVQMRGKPDPRGSSDDGRSRRSSHADDGIRVPKTYKRPKTIRCRCELTIFYRAPTPHMQSRVKGTDRNQLLRIGELCTIAMDPNDPSLASVKLDDPFFIKASQLFVLTYRGPIKSFTLADNYYSQVTFHSIDTETVWPPPLISDLEDFIDATSNTPGEQADAHSINLVCAFTNLPQIPRKGEWNKMRTTAGLNRCLNLNGRFELELDCGWSNPFSTITSKPETQLPRANRMPTPNSEKDVAVSRMSPRVNYHFRRNEGPLEDVPGVNGQSGQYSKFQVKGYVCPFCDRKEFSDCNRLQFHLVTCHDLFDFSIQLKKAPRLDDVYADIWVDLSKRYSGSSVGGWAQDPREFMWIRPEKPFNLEELLKGDWRWLNDKSDKTMPGQQQSLVRKVVIGKREIDPKEVQELQPRKKRKYTTPKALHKSKGPVFIRGKSKRFCYEAEELSESDDDVDENWLQQKHEDTIDDFEDLGVIEQTFMKKWDRHLFLERPIGWCHLPETIIRFARKEREWLRSSSQLVEFYKHILNLIQYKMVETKHLKMAMEIVKGDDGWSTAETATIGLGLAGPLLLDTPVTPAGTPAPALTNKNNSGDGRDNKMNDVEMGEASAPAQRITGHCVCGGHWKKSAMIFCDGPSCENQWYHMSCVGLDKHLDTWKCKDCTARESSSRKPSFGS